MWPRPCDRDPLRPSTQLIHPLPCPCRALTIQGRDDRLPQGQDQPERAPEQEEVCDLKVKLARGPRGIQHGGAARTAGAGLVPQHAGVEAAGGWPCEAAPQFFSALACPQSPKGRPPGGIRPKGGSTLWLSCRCGHLVTAGPNLPRDATAFGTAASGQFCSPGGPHPCTTCPLGLKMALARTRPQWHPTLPVASSLTWFKASNWRCPLGRAGPTHLDRKAWCCWMVSSS